MLLKLLVYLVVLVVLTVTGNPPDQIVVVSVVVYLFVCMLGAIVCLLVFIYLFYKNRTIPPGCATLTGRQILCLSGDLSKKKKKKTFQFHILQSLPAGNWQRPCWPCRVARKYLHAVMTSSLKILKIVSLSSPENNSPFTSIFETCFEGLG